MTTATVTKHQTKPTFLGLGGHGSRMAIRLIDESGRLQDLESFSAAARAPSPCTLSGAHGRRCREGCV